MLRKMLQESKMLSFLREDKISFRFFLLTLGFFLISCYTVLFYMDFGVNNQRFFAINSLKSGDNYLFSFRDFLGLIIFNAVVLIVDLWMARRLYERDKHLPRLLAFGASFFSLLILIFIFVTIKSN